MCLATWRRRHWSIYTGQPICVTTKMASSECVYTACRCHRLHSCRSFESARWITKCLSSYGRQPFFIFFLGLLLCARRRRQRLQCTNSEGLFSLSCLRPSSQPSQPFLFYFCCWQQLVRRRLFLINPRPCRYFTSLFHPSFYVSIHFRVLSYRPS